MTRIYFSAGDASGDVHGANLIRALRDLAPNLECAGLGGQQMAAAGMELHDDLAARGIMGFTEVLKSFGAIRGLFYDTFARLRRDRPDLLVLIDYPGFNIRLGRRAKNDLGIPIVYYISPQVWAWKKNRLHTLAKFVDRMLVILPFERDLYRRVGVDCVFVGHPLLDHIEATPVSGKYEGDCVVGLLPGSRAQEIERILPIMLEVARGIRARHPEARFLSPCVDAARANQIRAIAGDFPLEIALGETYEVLHAARFCMVASGTATVETALFGVPMVILYRVAETTYRLARAVVDIDTIGMVNILAGRRIVPEFIQHGAHPEAILPVSLELIADSPERAAMLADLAQVRADLGSGGASARAARAILEIVEQPHA